MFWGECRALANSDIERAKTKRGVLVHSTRDQKTECRQGQELKAAITAYRERFEVGPPIFGMEEADALHAINQALTSGKEITRGAEGSIPKGALL